ncbi:FAD-dependent monooxygenase [Kitasatospora sp. NPDC048296]|uniref:FAD-dependent monooxygenase n=1 Tax=Kitasatospora sp. NPDC048296 TaxID=3364048 RepID=UPI00371BBA14
MTDPIIIAGGGPVGLMLAFELGRQGVPAVVLEARPGHYDDERVGTFHSRLVDVFTERGLMDALGEAPHWPAVHFGMVWLDLTQLPEEYNLLVAQTGVERLLEERSAALGADLRRGHRVTGFSQDDSGVTVQVEGPDGAAYELRGAYLVGADGVDSTVRRLAGIEVSRTGKSWYGILGDFASYDGEFDAGVRPGGVFGALPERSERGYWRLQTLEFDQDGPPESEPVTVEELMGNIERLTGGRKQVGDPIWMRRYTGTTQLAERYREGRVFLAGEAAHHYVPTASHGLNTGLGDAVNLAWRLAAAVHGWAPEGLLDGYHEERHLAGHRACQGAEAQMALIHPLEKVNALREVFTELVTIEEVNRRLVTWATDVRYPFAAEGGHPLVGLRLGHLALRTTDGETSTGAALGQGRGVLFDLTGKEFGDASGWESRVDVVRAEPVEELDAPALLVRPDGYTVWVGDDQDGLTAALTTWFGAPTAD